MTTEDFIIKLFCRVDDQMKDLTKHPQANLHPSEIVTLAMLFALKGVGDRAFSRWPVRDWRPLFPKLPERTRLFRSFKTHQAWTNRFLAEPTALGVADAYGIELLHPYREGRSEKPIGKKGCSNHRWIVGGKLCYVLNRWGRIVGWDCATANVHDAAFHPLLRSFEEKRFILVDHGFFSQKENPANMKVCKRGGWNVRMMAETVLSMLTTVCHFKRLRHRV
ncbi:MAG: hypothetical protein QW299_07945, partial [Candidatus Caldarchaeum sp.]